MLKLVFAGTPDVAVPSLKAFATDPRFDVVGVITRPDAPTGRGRKLTPSPVKATALELGLPVIDLKPRSPEFMEALNDLHADIAAVIAYGNILPKNVLDAVPLGWYNLHFSNLPKWRGAAPAQRAIWAGDPTTGADVFKVGEGLDDGPIVASLTIELTGRETSGELLDRLAEEGAPMYVDALAAGTRNTLSVGVACGIAGIIAGVVTMTGLANVLITAIVQVANGQLIIALFLTMLCCIVLGMGVPTTANYVIMATTCAPILVQGMGMDLMAANFFVFYFGIVADITPPVALAAYAGSAIAKAPPMRTAFNATRLAIAAFIVPYIFAFNNTMLFIGDFGPLDVVQVVLTSSVGMFLIAAGMIGYMLRDLNWGVRIVCIAAGLMLIHPGTLTDIIGIGVLVVVLVFQIITGKGSKAVKAA